MIDLARHAHIERLRCRLVEMRREPELYSPFEVACVEKEFADLREHLTTEEPR